jgi:hypothetical protein
MCFKKKKKNKLMSAYGTMRDKKDYSKKCSRNELTEKKCLLCINYIYPIGCKLKGYNAFK